MMVISPAKLFDLWLGHRLVPYGRMTPDDDEKARLIKMIHLNEAYTIILGNYANAISVSMRNGVIGIVLILMLAVFQDGRLW